MTIEGGGTGTAGDLLTLLEEKAYTGPIVMISATKFSPAEITSLEARGVTEIFSKPCRSSDLEALFDCDTPDSDSSSAPTLSGDFEEMYLA